MPTRRIQSSAANVKVRRAPGGRALCLAAIFLFVAGTVHAIGEDQQPSGSAWELLRSKYYGDSSIGVVDEGYMSLEVPANTPDPAATPLTLHFADDEHRRIRRVRVFIDNNPSPLVATFDFAGNTSHGIHPVDVANIIPPQAPGSLAVQAGLASDHGWCPIKPETFESRLIAGVYVIGDACIADPMPKAASAANAQGKRCALAIVAALEGRDGPPSPVLESVCYSMLARGIALSLHGRFVIAGDVIEQEPAPAAAAGDSGPAVFEQEARNADGWYASIVAGSFGA